MVLLMFFYFGFLNYFLHLEREISGFQIKGNLDHPASLEVSTSSPCSWKYSVNIYDHLSGHHNSLIIGSYFISCNNYI